jgi:diacylglycerol kinase (ATP)
MTRRALLLLNPGARNAGKLASEVPAALLAEGIESSSELIGRARPIQEIIRDYAERVDCIIVAGGDGTIGSAASGLVATGLPLGILPLGTANNVARTLGIPADLAKACAIIGSGEVRRIDVGQVNDRYFFTTASLGLSVAITEELSPETKRRWGVLAYVVTAAKVVVRARPFVATIEWPGGSMRTRSVQIVVGNGRFYGSGLRVAEDAAIDDRRLDLYSIDVQRWWKLLTLAPALRKGSHRYEETVRTASAQEFEIRTGRPQAIDVDGELSARTPAHFRVLPGAVGVFAPPISESHI